MVVTLDTALREVLGGRTATKLATIDLHTVSDLLRYYPRKYSERGRLTDLAVLRAGDKATVWARVASVTGRVLGPPRRVGRRGPKYLTKVRLSDGHRDLECAFFNQPWLSKQLTVGMEVLASGTVSDFRGTLQMSGPELAIPGAVTGTQIDEAITILEEFAGGIIPTYPESTGVTTSLLQRCVRQVLGVLGPVVDPLPDALLRRRDLIDLGTALRHIHRPDSREALDLATRRLTYDEALALQLVLARRRAAADHTAAYPCPPVAGALADRMSAALPFELTAGQVQVGAEISADLASPHPMNRLLQGDVGSGKTVVALRAMLQVIDAGHQAALLAPTEVLATQHAQSLRELLGPLGKGGELEAAPGAIAVTLLTGSASAAARRAALTEIASGRPGIVIGTHALLSDDVMFGNLGLVVVDEQHRFGVEQRDRLRSADGNDARPHLLVMTATPIPRTVAMTVYGDLEVSTLTGAPLLRAGYTTTVVPALEKPGWLDRAWQRAREEVAKGHQVYVVCPKIESEGDEDEAGRRKPLAVTDVAKQLSDGPLAGLRLGTMHGRLSADAKAEVMADFSAGQVDLLVSTTVIEVGVDVPNATMMVILDAERFGMSQLHQLRGRVGRGAAPGVCLLVTEAPAASDGRARLDAVAATSDGFVLAEEDLRLRREGDVLGVSQSGRRTTLKLLSLVRDREMITTARDDARGLVGGDPSLRDHPGLAAMADAIVAEADQDYLDKA